MAAGAFGALPKGDILLRFIDVLHAGTGRLGG